MSIEQERALRRTLTKHGFKLEKTPARSWLRQYFRVGYQIVDRDRNLVVLGCHQQRYEATLEECEAFAADLERVAS